MAYIASAAARVICLQLCVQPYIVKPGNRYATN